MKKAENINTVKSYASFAEHSKMPIRLHPVLPIISVMAKSQDGRHQVLTYALLDSGSSNTFCSEELANELHLTGRHASIPVSTVDQAKTPVYVKVVNFKLMDVKQEYEVIVSAYAKSNMHISVELVATSDEVKRWPHLRDVQIVSLDNERCIS